MSVIQQQQAAAMREFFEQYLGGLITYSEFMLQLANFQVNYERNYAKELS